jgi:hypothetical protein
VSGYAYVLGLTGAGLVVALVIELLRRRHLRGKYAVLWLALALVCLVFALFPGLLGRLSEVVGVETPANLLFFLAILTMLAVIMQLSYQSGVTEEKTRTLAEEVAFLRLEVESLRADVRAHQAAGPRTGERAS